MFSGGQKLKIFPYTLALLLFSWINSFSFNTSQQQNIYWNIKEKKKTDLIEEIQEYNSVIDWTGGKIRTEIAVPIQEENPNIGKIINNYESRLKEELRQNLIKAMGYLRISDLFLLKDYYSINSDIRYEIISYADRATYFPIIQKGNSFLGIAELNLFGKNGIVSIFFRNLENKTLEKYIHQDSREMEYFDGLIIDTITYPNFNPSIQMRIYDEDGVLLYGPETIEKEALEKYGVCEYTTGLFYAFNSPRCGNKIFYTIPFDIIGKMNTYFVLNNKDAARLFSNPRTVRSINQARVVVVKTP